MFLCWLLPLACNLSVLCPKLKHICRSLSARLFINRHKEQCWCLMHMTLVPGLFLWGAQRLFLLGIARPMCSWSQVKTFISSIQYVKICRSRREEAEGGAAMKSWISFLSHHFHWSTVKFHRVGDVHSFSQCEWQWVFVALYMSTECGLKCLKIAPGIKNCLKCFKITPRSRMCSLNRLLKIWVRSCQAVWIYSYSSWRVEGLISSSSTFLWVEDIHHPWDTDFVSLRRTPEKTGFR